MANKKSQILELRDVVYKNYNKETNMTIRQLLLWAKNPLSKKVSRNRKPLQMAIRLKSKRHTQWKMTELKWALRKAIPYLKRVKRSKGKKLIKGKYTKKAIALKNFGYDVKKKAR